MITNQVKDHLRDCKVWAGPALPERPQLSQFLVAPGVSTAAVSLQPPSLYLDIFS